MTSGKNLGAMGLAAVAGLIAAPAVQAQEPAPVNTGKVSFNLGVDVVTQYWFRGMARENQGLILQPYADATFGLLGEGNFTLDYYIGTWNSIHRDAPSSAGSQSAWFESDFFTGVALGLPYGFTVDLAYVNLYSPANGGSFAEEIDLAIAWDDSELMASLGVPFALNPYALFAFEFEGGSDLGNDEGTYLELGVEPSFALTDSEDYPITLSVPLTVGLGLNDYYEDGAGRDDTYGFFDVGAVVSVPLSFIPADYGAWQASAGLHWIHTGKAARNISGPTGLNVTGGKDNYFYGTFGISMSY